MSYIYYINNPEKFSPGFFPEEITCLPPYDYLAKERDETDQLVVLCEMDINADDKTVNRSDFYGISFVQELRRKSYKNKVLFVSFCDREFLSNNSHFSIINTIGHDFMLLPSSPIEWIVKLQNTPDLSDLNLLVCQNSYCNKHGIIDTITHSLYSKSHSPDDYRQMFEDLKKLYPQDNNSASDNTFKQLSIDSEKTDNKDNLPYTGQKEKKAEFIHDTPSSYKTSLRTFIENYARSLKDAHPEASETMSKVEPITKYKILWLDDEVTDQHVLYKTFDNHIELLHARTVDEAKKYITEDLELRRPQIMLVIADYFLKEKRDGVLVDQKAQGYDFLLEVSRSDHPAQIVALSSMQRHLQSWIAEHYGVQYKELPKKVLRIDTPEGANYVYNESIQLANETWKKIVTRPISSKWQELAPLYGYHIKNPDYDQEEDKINEEVQEWISAYHSTGQNPGNVDFGRQGFNKFYSDPKYEKDWKGIQDNFFSQFRKWVDFVEKAKKSGSPTPVIDQILASLKVGKKDLKKWGLNWLISSASSDWITDTWKEELKTIVEQIKRQRESNHSSTEGLLSKIGSLTNYDDFHATLRSIFIQRRIILYLSMIEKKDKDELAQITGVKYGKNGSNFRNYLSELGLQLDQPELTMTWEETHWIQQKSSGLNIPSYQKDYRQALEEMELKAGAFLSSLPDLKIASIKDKKAVQFLKVDQVKELLKELTDLFHVKKGEEDWEQFQAFIDLLHSLKSVAIDYMHIPDVLSLSTNIDNLNREKHDQGKNIFYTFKQYHAPWLFFGANIRRWGSEGAQKENQNRKDLFLKACSTEEIKIKKECSDAFMTTLLERCKEIYQYYNSADIKNNGSSPYVKQRQAIYTALTNKPLDIVEQKGVSPENQDFQNASVEMVGVDEGFEYTYDRDLSKDELRILDTIFQKIIPNPHSDQAIPIISEEKKCRAAYQAYMYQSPPDNNRLVLALIDQELEPVETDQYVVNCLEQLEKSIVAIYLSSDSDLFLND